MPSIYYILSIPLFSFLLIYIRQKRIICSIRRMDNRSKAQQLNTLMQPFGFFFLPAQGLISSVWDPWQREFGYMALYDRSAPYFNMIFHCEPIYFDYNDRTWLIEFWKGQYGINTGCEIGIYHADSILSEDQYDRTLFHAADDDEMLPLSMKLFTDRQLLLSVGRVHWWLTAFLPGCFSRPQNLTMHISITFPNVQMLQNFVRAAARTGYRSQDIDIDGYTVSLLFAHPHIPQPRTFFAFYPRWVQWKNRVFCLLYRFFTQPFCCTDDRILYLCRSLSIAFRHMMRFRRCRAQLPPHKQRNQQQILSHRRGQCHSKQDSSHGGQQCHSMQDSSHGEQQCHPMQDSMPRKKRCRSRRRCR